jgi:hypothetical protein
MSVRTRLTVSLAAAALLLAGCGSTNLSGLLSQAGNASSAPAAPDLGSGSGGSGGSGSGAGLGILSSDCMGVVSAYTSIAMALVPSLGGTGTYDSSQVASAISGLGGKVPAALQPDFQVLSGAAKQASGKSMEQAGTILGSDAVSKASDDISNWMDKNCGT